MKRINIYFKEFDPIEVELINHTVADKFFYLANKHYIEYPIVFRDPLKYTYDYLEKLIVEANEKLHWNCKTQNLTEEDIIDIHKNLENTLNDEGDFRSIPEEFDNLIHEFHYCLHRIQHKDKPNRIGYFQIEWFNNEFIPMDNDFSFTNNLKFGDIILQNPFVGHNPLHCYHDDDYTNIDRTCKIPCRIKSGIIMYTIPKAKEIDYNHYYEWWDTRGKSVLDKVGYDTILRFTGEGKIGEVINKDTLREIIETPNILEFDKLEFID